MQAVAVGWRASAGARALALARDAWFAGAARRPPPLPTTTMTVTPGLCRGMAGHSHWHNIRHIKQAKDSQRGQLISRCVRMIQRAIREGGGNNNPEVNMELARAIKYARNCEVEKVKIEKAIKGSNKPLESFVFEIKGPGNCFLLVETLSENRRRMKNELRSAVKKIPLTTVLDGGTLGHVFSQKGIVLVEKADGMSVESVLDHAIEAGAEDVQEGEHEGGTKVLEFITDPVELRSVTKSLEALKYSIVSSDLRFQAQIKQTLSEESMELVGKLYDIITEIPEVVEVYDNVEQ